MSVDCGCGNSKYNLVFACSGASDVGCISDQTARRLAQEKVSFMSCAAGIAAQIPEILEKTRGATRILAIDGCDKDCCRKILEANQLPFTHLRLEDLGMKKGESPATEERIQLAANQARNMI